jgi:hypothetical protein
MNCFPVFLDLILGIPNYQPYFYEFTIAQSKNEVRLVYDIYVFFIVLSLGLYSNYSYKNYKVNNNIASLDKVSKLFASKILILLPFIHILFSPYAMDYIMIYGQALQRGATTEFGNLNALLCLISIIAFCQSLFPRKGKKSDYFILAFYSFLIIWINGKRNIILILASLFIYYYSNTIWKNRHKINLKIFSIVFVISLVLYSTFYLVETKGTINFAWDEIYTMARIDYGRDDVTKFVINMESFEDDPIQEYRAQGLVGTLFMYVPRSIWEGKPYSHYRYLTAKLVGLDPETIHFGMTPSILEQSIADFGNLGYPICLLFLILFCRYTDKQNNLFLKSLLLILILGALSMSMDYLGIYIVILILVLVLSYLRRLINGILRYKITNTRYIRH